MVPQSLWARKRLVLIAALCSVAFAPTLAIAQDSQSLVRIQQLEEQVRTLTGQLEGLQFQVTQMQTLIERQTEDTEFRFQALEGGGGGGGAPATDTAPAADLQGAVDVPAEGVVPLPGELEIDPTFDESAGALGESMDPLAGTGEGGSVTLGALDPAEAGNAASDPAAQAQYRAGYDAVVAGDFAGAEQQFRQFLDTWPQDPQAPDATNWLGEALIQRGEFDQAADVLLTGFQNYQDSARAPDLLLKLGIALNGAGEADTACRTFLEVQKRYPSVPPAFSSRLLTEMERARCAQ